MGNGTSPEQRKAAKLRRYLAAQGISGYVPAGPAIAHVRALREAGKSTRWIAQASGVHYTRIGHLAVGMKSGRPVTELRRSTAEKILAVPLEPQRRQAELGKKMSPIGAQRRLQALQAVGYSNALVSLLLGWGPNAYRRVFDLQTNRGDATFIYQRTHDKIAELYEKYKDVDPRDLSGDHRVDMILAHARRRRYAPPSCWDPPDIDDPEAFPEWTGLCGTVEGYRIHRREDIPQCRACVIAKTEYGRDQRKADKKAPPPPPVNMAECGTESAARRHRRKGEEICAPCRKAELKARQRRKEGQAA